MYPAFFGVGLECDSVVKPRTGDVKPYNLYVEGYFSLAEAAHEKRS